MKTNDSAWKKLFDKYRILDEIKQNGYYAISTDQIREFREPRLMTKFDHQTNLPTPLSENNLSILPISRRDYMISTFSAYQKFDSLSSDIQPISIPAHLQSLSPQYLVSEAIALNCANVSGLLSDFLEDDEIVPTVSGRMSSGEFGFDIEVQNGKKHIDVSNSQIEIDAAYEGRRFLSLFEAKRDLAEDFLIRQLYYPMRVWRSRVTKEVKTIFLIFSNGIFHLYQYHFDNPYDYNSLRLIKQKSYMIATEITLADIENILQFEPLIEEPEIPFPQANSMLRIINLLELLYEEPMTSEKITSKYSFDKRQTNYYTDAGRYLGLVEKQKTGREPISYCLTQYGNYIMGLPLKQRQLEIVKRILRHKAFNATLKLHLQHGEMPDTQTIVQIMKQAELYKVASDSTYERRSSTIVGWINWILQLIKEQ